MIINKRSFTLIELMMAVVIITLVVTGSLLSFTYLLILTDSSVNLTIAASDAQYVLEQMKSLAYSSISTYTAPALNNLPNETVTLTRSMGANLATITVNISWLEKTTTKNYSLSTYIAK